MHNGEKQSNPYAGSQDNSITLFEGPAPAAAPVLRAGLAGGTRRSAARADSAPQRSFWRGLHKGHPRLLASSNDFAQLTRRIAADPALESWRTKLRQRAQEITAAAPSRYEIPDGLRLLDTSRRVVDRVYVLGLLHRLEGKPAYAERAWQELDAAAHFPDWNPRHFLDTAEMTHAFAVAYDWLYDSWTPEQRALLRQAMVEKGLKPALGLYRTGGWWTQARHNWNQVCNGGIGMGALALGEVEPELAGEILESALKSLQLAMAEFAPDGAWKEGPGYWNYATFYNVVFLAAPPNRPGHRFRVVPIQRVRPDGLVSDLPDRPFRAHLQLRRWRRPGHSRPADVLAGAAVRATGVRLVRAPGCLARRTGLALARRPSAAGPASRPDCRWTSASAAPRSPSCAASGRTRRRCSLGFKGRATIRPITATWTWAALSSTPWGALGHGPGSRRLQPPRLFWRPAMAVPPPARRRPEHPGPQSRPGTGPEPFRRRSA